MYLRGGKWFEIDDNLQSNSQIQVIVYFSNTLNIPHSAFDVEFQYMHKYWEIPASHNFLLHERKGIKFGPRLYGTFKNFHTNSFGYIDPLLPGVC